MPCNGKNNLMLSPHSLEPMPCNLLTVAWRTKAYIYPHCSSRRGIAAQPCSVLRSKPALWAVGEQLCSVLHRVDEVLEAPVGAWSTRCEICIGSCYTSVWPDLQVYWLLLHFSLACSNPSLFDGVHKNWQANPMGGWKEAFVEIAEHAPTVAECQNYMVLWQQQPLLSVTHPFPPYSSPSPGGVLLMEAKARGQ